ncbi:MAG TPA: hypothetical protein VJ997_11630, partial [Longimicrobiales bacterium]|nr:hypothetical protein [Longimicrobiales bacterium]
PSAIDYLDSTGKLTTVELDSTQMLDRFATLVMRTGDTLSTYPLRVTDGARSGIVYRVRYNVGAQARSERVPITCAKAAEPPASDTVPRLPIQPRRQP